jgi:hypothetical protein
MTSRVPHAAFVAGEIFLEGEQVAGCLVHSVVSELDLGCEPASVCRLDDRVDLKPLVVAVEADLRAMWLGVDAQVMGGL